MSKISAEYLRGETFPIQEELIELLIKKRAAYNEAVSKGGGQLADKLYDEYRQMMKEIHLQHPEFMQSIIDQSVKNEALDLTKKQLGAGGALPREVRNISKQIDAELDVFDQAIDRMSQREAQPLTPQEINKFIDEETQNLNSRHES